jgi:hypothetical protein
MSMMDASKSNPPPPPPSTDVWKSIVDERSIAQAMETKLPFFLVTIFAIVSCNKFSKLSFFFLKIL